MARNLTQERAHEYFSYDRATGALINKERPETDFANPSRHAQHLATVGKRAGYQSKEHGYRKASVDGVQYMEHQIIWLMVYGYIPKPPLFVSHRSVDRSDNRLENLQEQSKSAYCRLAGMPKNNTSGVTGIAWHKASGKWRARIKVNGEDVTVGLFDRREDAIAARSAAEAEHGFSNSALPSFNRSKQKAAAE